MLHDLPLSLSCRWHEEGSVGIENASPAAITQALKTARPSFPDTRKEFTVQELQELGLANTFDAKQVSLAPASPLERNAYDPTCLYAYLRECDCPSQMLFYH